MSEYPGIRRKKTLEDLDNTETLFDAALTTAEPTEIDRMVDVLNIPYSEARERLGIPDEPVSEYGAGEQPVWAVSIDERATALNAIMTYLNKANKTNGSRVHIENGGQRMVEQYGVPAIYDVQQGAEANRDKLRAGFFKGIETLAGVEQMRALGVDEDTIEHERLKIQMGINKEFGVGNAYAPKRNKIARTAQGSADIISGRKKPRGRGK